MSNSLILIRVVTVTTGVLAHNPAPVLGPPGYWAWHRARKLLFIASILTLRIQVMLPVNSFLWQLLMFDTSSAFAHSASICWLSTQRVKAAPEKGFT
ncbi:hypothetical protein PWF83_18945 [Pantoea dispersa]|uniref:hypothetical protein n=1 Tax=Pantoea dispersa TaxID=59814 RepID=UPI0023A9FA05|nr:hypothetical protein [Pantoea dispersa]WEA05742.1 hypothetical protein PWF83_18945 [Pantoea dispersa]